jgi:hypothetical protein
MLHPSVGKVDDGSQADVYLNQEFNVLTTAADNESPDDKDEPDDD